LPHVQDEPHLQPAPQVQSAQGQTPRSAGLVGATGAGGGGGGVSAAGLEEPKKEENMVS
jgi:hypothetical protein